MVPWLLCHRKQVCLMQEVTSSIHNFRHCKRLDRTSAFEYHMHAGRRPWNLNVPSNPDTCTDQPLCCGKFLQRGDCDYTTESKDSFSPPTKELRLTVVQYPFLWHNSKIQQLWKVTSQVPSHCLTFWRCVLLCATLEYSHAHPGQPSYFLHLVQDNEINRKQGIVSCGDTYGHNQVPTHRCTSVHRPVPEYTHFNKHQTY